VTETLDGPLLAAFIDYPDSASRIREFFARASGALFGLLHASQIDDGRFVSGAIKLMQFIQAE